MAQVGYTPIQLYYSTTSGVSGIPSAGNLTNGELAINITDGKLFYKDNSGSVQVIGTKGGVGSSSTTQVLYNVGGLVVGSSSLTFDGTILTAGGLAGPHNGTVGATTPNTGVFTTAKAIAAATQDSVILQGRAGGTSSYGVTLTPTTLTASRTLTLPDASGTILQSGTAVTIAQGGTGQTSASAAFNALSPITSTGDLIIGNGTNSATRLAISSTPGYVLTSNGTTAAWAASTGGVTSVGATAPVASSGGSTPTISLNTAYGDALNPYASKTQNYVLASPNGSAGVPTFRAIVAADIPTLNQNTTGTAAGLSATLAIASGGTGQTTANTAFNALAPSQTSNSGKYLTTDGTNTSWATVSSGGSPGGSSGNLQYNNGSGGFAGSTNLTWDNTNGLLGIGGTPTASKGTFQVGTIGYTDTGVLAGFASSTAGYNQIILQNTSSNAAASTNFNVSNDAGTASTNFGEFGINSSAFTGTGSFSTAGNVYLAAASTDLVVGTYGNKPIRFVVNSGATDAAIIDNTGNFGIGQATPGSKLDVKGTLRLSGATSGYVGLAPAAVAGSTVYTLPAADGTNGQFLKTDGAATLSWATASGGSSGPILESQIVISQNYSLSNNTNGFSVGPVSVATGFAVTVGTGQTWLVSQ